MKQWQWQLVCNSKIVSHLQKLLHFAVFVLLQLLYSVVVIIVSQAARTVVTMTSKVNAKTGTLTPVDLKPLKIFITKIGHIDYVAASNTHAKFYGNRPRGVCPPHK